jgi:hypothetical protein
MQNPLEPTCRVKALGLEHFDTYSGYRSSQRWLTKRSCMSFERVANRSGAVLELGQPSESKKTIRPKLEQSRVGTGRRATTGRYGYDLWSCGCRSQNTLDDNVIVFQFQCSTHQHLFRPLVRQGLPLS